MSTEQEPRSMGLAESGDLPEPTGEVMESNCDTVVDTFEGFNLSEGLIRGIYAYGFEKPSAIQQRGIKPIIDGFDTIGNHSLSRQKHTSKDEHTHTDKHTYVCMLLQVRLSPEPERPLPSPSLPSRR